MTAWDQLVSLSVTGIAGKPVPIDGYHPLVSSHLGGQFTDPIDIAYQIAALTTVATRAGVGPGPAVEPLPPAPTDEQPEISPALAELVCRAIEHGQPLAFWAIQEIAARNHRMPVRLIPKLLQLSAGQRGLRAEVSTTLGLRGLWVAGVLGISDAAASDDSMWAHGSAEQRGAWLSALRHADPDRAREALEIAWNKEKAGDREALLATFTTGLTLADEEFLEQALDDRANGVRKLAASLLADLPGSALQQRMARRVLLLITARKRLGRLTINVTLPDDLDEQAARDGINTGQAPAGTGRGVWLLRQLLDAAPLPLLAVGLEATPRAIVHSLPKEFAADIVESLAHRAVREHDGTWSLALCEHRACPDSIAATLPDPERSEYVENRLSTSDTSGSALLATVPAPWSSKVCAAAVRRLIREVKDPAATGWRWSTYTSQLALNLPVGQSDPWLDQLSDLRAKAPDTWAAILTEVTDALTLRSAIAKELP